MGFVETVQTCFRKYFDFGGRARRSEYWYFILFIFIASIVLGLLDMAIFGMPDVSGEPGAGGFFESPMSNIFSLATLIPSTSAASRRLHDTGRSGWFQLLAFVPAVMLGFMMGSGGAGGIVTVLALAFVGLTILLIVWLATDSEPGDNRFGPNPKQ